ncbi:MAG: hypothetical protein HYZ65_13190 [Burkholderiales bacterium]|nr:hypothetical protein [Burkholderiales bacterium]
MSLLACSSWRRGATGNASILKFAHMLAKIPLDVLIFVSKRRLQSYLFAASREFFLDQNAATQYRTNSSQNLGAPNACLVRPTMLTSTGAL